MIGINKKYQTRYGKEVKIYSTVGGGEYPVHGAIYDKEEDMWNASCWTPEGDFWDGDSAHPDDLVEVKQQVLYWRPLNVILSECQSYEIDDENDLKLTYADGEGSFNLYLTMRELLECGFPVSGTGPYAEQLVEYKEEK